MKEAFKKIIERLEEEVKGWLDLVSVDETVAYAEISAYNKAINIVKEVAEEYDDGWIPCSERLPKDDSKEYMVQKTNSRIDILGFTKDAYKLDEYDFAEYKGKNKPIFYDFDSEYGFIEHGCVAWQPLPEKYKPKGE